jgi:type I restriction enzyme S subunit
MTLLECTRDGQISYGIVQPGRDTEGGVPMLRVTNLISGRLDYSEIIRVSNEIEQSYSRTRLEGGEVLLSLVGSTGNCILAPKRVAGWNGVDPKIETGE